MLRIINGSFLFFHLKLSWPCRAFVVVSVDPALIGVSPVVAISAIVKAAGLEFEDIDLFLDK